MFSDYTRPLAVVAVLGLVAMVACGLAGCSTAASVRDAYCAGVSAGGRAALAELATGQPNPVIACDPAPDAPAPGAIFVVIRGAADAPVTASPPPPVAVLAEPIDPVV